MPTDRSQRSVSLVVSVSRPTMDRIEAQAKTNGVSRAEVIRRAVIRQLGISAADAAMGRSGRPRRPDDAS